jgi:hypothetical protein
MVIPPGPHQVTNVGDVEVKILFVEVSPILEVVVREQQRRASEPPPILVRVHAYTAQRERRSPCGTWLVRR